MSWLTEVRPPQNPHPGWARKSARFRKICGSAVPVVPADDVHTRSSTSEPEGVHPLRPSHARRPALERLDWTFDEALHPHRAAQGAARSAALPRQQALCRPAARSAREDRTGRRLTVAHGTDRRPQGGRRRHGLRVHGRLDGRRRRRGHRRRRGEAGGAAGRAAGDRVHRVRRRAHAGGRGQPDADAAHHHRHAVW